MTLLHDRRTFLKGCSSILALAPRGATARSAADGARFDEVTGFIESQVQGREVPGTGLAVVQNGRMLYEQYWGSYFFREGRSQEPFNGSVIVPCYSFSKLITATVIAILRQDGLLDYDAPVSKYIAEFKGGGKDPITLRHLLTHSAGLPDVPLKAVASDREWDAAVETICAADVAWEPGSQCKYHRLTGSFVAAEAAQRVSGQRWAMLCRQRLFEPLGALHMGFELPPPDSRLAFIPRPKSVAVQQMSFGRFFGLSLLGHPGGACFGTTGDMLKVLQLHLQRGNWRGKSLIRPDVLAEMHTVKYQRQILQAVRDGQEPVHQSWGLGPLLRGTGPVDEAHAWFGFGDRASAGIFGHAGISTVIGVGDPSLDLAIVFVTTDEPQPETKAPAIRNGVTNRVFKALVG
ncbi:MAG: serine hydrolase domain-containing protein [Planctomycetaceae bacterium]